ncbi:MAG: hypothetical protein AAF371_15385 [Pseudomonadota bacterium]
MIALLLATLLSVTIPEGAEPYLSDNSVYAEVEGADVTVIVFEAVLAAQAIAEFRETHEDPSTARAGVTVSRVDSGTIAGRPSTTIDYAKPGPVARMNADGQVEIVAGNERTRQVYLDLGGPHLVLTVWTKADEVDIEGLADRLASGIVAGEGATDGAVIMTLDGMPLGAAGESLADAPLAEPITIDVTAE